MPPLGLALSGRAGFGVGSLASHARAAEAAGFSAVFATETANDPVAQAICMAVATSSVTVGTAITNLSLRHPAAVAMTCAVAGDAAPGRFLLGVGTGNPQINGDVLGLPSTPPLVTAREYLQVLHDAQRGPIDHRGDVYQVRGLELTHRAGQPVPVYLAALQTGMLRVAGRHADGAILHLSSPETAAASAAVVRDAAAEAGRSPADVPVACMVPICPDEDLAAALTAARQTVLRYALHPVASQLFASSGHADQMARVGELLQAGDEDAAREAVDEELASSFVAHGTPAACRTQVQAYREAGIDLPIAFPMPAGGGSWDDCVDRTIAALSTIT